MNSQFLIYTSSELKEIINGLEYLNDEDVKNMYGFDTVEEATIQLWEDYEEAVERELEYEDSYQAHGFNGAYDYNSYRF
jgi:hypothetical protein